MRNGNSVRCAVLFVSLDRSSAGKFGKLTDSWSASVCSAETVAAGADLTGDGNGN